MGDIEYPSLKGKVSDAEWRTRVELAAIYRLYVLLGWFDLSMPPASARIPGEDCYLYNPSGILYDEITASSLVKVTFDGELAAETPFEYLRGAWYPQQAGHSAGPDANFVLHTHDDYCEALSAVKGGLLPISQTSGFALADGVSYHAYDGVETYPHMVDVLRTSLGSNRMMILENHGLITVGHTAWIAVTRMNLLRKACRVQLMAAAAGELIHLTPEVQTAMVTELKAGPVVGNPWASLLRKLDRLDPSYKD
jgi:ribulose-5-phosphate 4-epimerase/fuculose-1-phosphate aldolase